MMLNTPHSNGAFAEPNSLTPKPKRSGHSRRLPVAGLRLDNPEIRVKVGHMMALLGVSHSTLYERIKTGMLPKPDASVGKKPMWWAATVLQVLAGLDRVAAEPARSNPSKPVPGQPVDKS